MNPPTTPIFEGLPNLTSGDDSSSDASFDSLFDEYSISNNSRIPLQKSRPPVTPAKRDLSTINVPGLFYDPTILLPTELEALVVNECLRTWFIRPHEVDPHSNDEKTGFFAEGLSLTGLEFNNVNQVMLFNRTDETMNDATEQSAKSGWPGCLSVLLMHVSRLLKPPVIDAHIWDVLFSPRDPSAADKQMNSQVRSRQAIINLYHPGEGISDHIDLLDRYGDGVIGVSFGTGCVMRFRYADEANSGGHQKSVPDGQSEIDETEFAQIYLLPRSIITMTGDVRYKWTHGIQGRMADFIQPESASSTLESDGNVNMDTECCRSSEQEVGVWIERGMRLSVTFRWLLPGADVVGSKLDA